MWEAEIERTQFKGSPGKKKKNSKTPFNKPGMVVDVCYPSYRGWK
jgi:hypothetical protein